MASSAAEFARRSPGQRIADRNTRHVEIAARRVERFRGAAAAPPAPPYLQHFEAYRPRSSIIASVAPMHFPGAGTAASGSGSARCVLERRRRRISRVESYILTSMILYRNDDTIWRGGIALRMVPSSRSHPLNLPGIRHRARSTRQLARVKCSPSSSCGRISQSSPRRRRRRRAAAGPRRPVATAEDDPDERRRRRPWRGRRARLDPRHATRGRGARVPRCSGQKPSERRRCGGCHPARRR